MAKAMGAGTCGVAVTVLAVLWATVTMATDASTTGAPTSIILVWMHFIINTVVNGMTDAGLLEDVCLEILLGYVTCHGRVCRDHAVSAMVAMVCLFVCATFCVKPMPSPCEVWWCAHSLSPPPCLFSRLRVLDTLRRASCGGQYVCHCGPGQILYLIPPTLFNCRPHLPTPH